ncbi:MAG TPA: sigma-70 family RNA polymerase sigma factor [Nannocystaceae bacterium]|nr:sigma-70 family RNA polymerase sigma factor [Nannocystaceae bacterium]
MTEASPVGPGGTAITGGFEELYRKHYGFVWRSVRRLGVSDPELDDVVQEVFVVVHRRLHEFEGRSAITTWLFGIAYRTVSDHRRKNAARLRREAEAGSGRPPTEPDQRLSRRQAVGVLDGLLAELDDEKREVLVMADIVKMTANEIAEITGANPNTVSSRLRAARKTFEEALARYREREGGELPWMT